MITTIKNQAMIEMPTILTGYLVDGNKHIPLAQGNGDYREVLQAIAGTDEYVGNAIVPQEAYTNEELLAYAKRTKLSEIRDTHSSMDMSMWSASDANVMNKKKADTSVRLSELQGLARTPEQDGELSDYLNFFTYSKLLNKEEHTFTLDVEALSVVTDVNDYVFSYTQIVDSSGEHSRHFVKHGYEKDV